MYQRKLSCQYIQTERFSNWIISMICCLSERPFGATSIVYVAVFIQTRNIFIHTRSKETDRQTDRQSHRWDRFHALDRWCGREKWKWKIKKWKPKMKKVLVYFFPYVSTFCLFIYLFIYLFFFLAFWVQILAGPIASTAR